MEYDFTEVHNALRATHAKAEALIASVGSGVQLLAMCRSPEQYRGLCDTRTLMESVSPKLRVQFLQALSQSDGSGVTRRILQSMVDMAPVIQQGVYPHTQPETGVIRRGLSKLAELCTEGNLHDPLIVAVETCVLMQKHPFPVQGAPRKAQPAARLLYTEKLPPRADAMAEGLRRWQSMQAEALGGKGR